MGATSVTLLLVALSTLMGLGSCMDPNTAYWEAFDVLKTCRTGISQSPIDIKERDTMAKTGSKIVFAGYDTPINFVMKNDGTTSKLSPADSSVTATITAPHLNGDTFRFAQLHFHWGGDNKYGSEHLLDGYQAPIEVHLVHFNTKYGSTIEEALAMEGVSDNLAVLGILFDIIPCSVVELNTLVSELANIKNPQSKASISGLTLERFLPTDTDTFFSYSGSLTTPKCQEIVSWTVFKDSSFISQTQLDEFRKLMYPIGPLVNNYRSTQALNGRNVSMYTK
uniref:carbonic anhydrase n=1 Tax=Caligus rogercresseyi TaxID=217165 RepID=C1BPC8_CALRO|nr:Carbonic anhydrase 1 [Caligus rogercresseyi]